MMNLNQKAMLNKQNRCRRNQLLGSFVLLIGCLGTLSR